MSRTTNEVLAQAMKFLPPRYQSIEEVIAGVAAIQAERESTAETFAEASTIGGADGTFLTLLAKGFGVNRALEETDDSVRFRLRNAEEQVTRASILSAVNTVLAPYTNDTATMLEPWEEGFLDVDMWFDNTIFSDLHNGFVLVVPLVGDAPTGSMFFDSEYFDGEVYFGGGVEHPVYSIIIALVERIRAAGIRWRLYIDV